MRVDPSIGRLVGELLREVGAQLEVLTASICMAKSAGNRKKLDVG